MRYESEFSDGHDSTGCVEACSLWREKVTSPLKEAETGDGERVGGVPLLVVVISEPSSHPPFLKCSWLSQQISLFAVGQGKIAFPWGLQITLINNSLVREVYLLCTWEPSEEVAGSLNG